MSINLHSVVRSAITYLHPDAGATLYRGAGRINGPDGAIVPMYMQGIKVRAQVQSDSKISQERRDRIASEQVERKFYLYSETGLGERVAGIVRPLARPGDYFQLEADETWWAVDAILEDFTLSNWVCVRAVLQVLPPVLAFTPEPLNA